MKALRDDQIYDLADKIYWTVLDALNIESDCVMLDPDNDGTKNTEKGTNLYYAIEESLQNYGLEGY